MKKDGRVEPKCVPPPEPAATKKTSWRRATAPKPKKASTRPDIATLGGLLLAAGGILGGLVLEGGKLTDIAQVTALMIVLGGTIGAVMVTTPLTHPDQGREMSGVQSSSSMRRRPRK